MHEGIDFLFPYFCSVSLLRKLTYQITRECEWCIDTSVFCVDQSVGLRPKSREQRSVITFDVINSVFFFLIFFSYFFLIFIFYYVKRKARAWTRNWRDSLSFHFLCFSGLWDKYSFQDFHLFICNWHSCEHWSCSNSPSYFILKQA